MIERFYTDFDADGDFVIKDRENELVIIKNLQDAMYMLNKIDSELRDIKHILLIESSKEKDGDFRVWQTPPLKGDRRIMYGSQPK